MTQITVGGQPEHPDDQAAAEHLADLLGEPEPGAEPEPAVIDGEATRWYGADVAAGADPLAIPPNRIAEVDAAHDPRAPDPGAELDEAHAGTGIDTGAEPGLPPLPGDWPEGFTAADLAAATSPQTREAAAELAAIVPPLTGALSMYDAASPPASPPRTDAVLVYAGGMTPSPWTRQQMAAQSARYFLPCWVARGSGAGAGATEANAFLDWLTHHRAPAHIAVVLDVETRGAPSDLDYAASFQNVIHKGGHWLMLYGSTGNLFEYPPPPAGYWVANPPPAGTPAEPHQYPHRGVTATQWRFSAPGEPWDLSVLSESLAPHLWDRHWSTALLAEAQHMQASMLALITRLADYARTV